MSENNHTLNADQYLSFGSLSINLPGTLRERKVSRYEASLQSFIGTADQAMTRLAAYRDTHEQALTQCADTQQATDRLLEGAESQGTDFWTRLDAGGLSLLQRLSSGRSRSLLAEAQLQVYEGRLSESAYQQIKEVVSEPWSSLRGQSVSCVCDLSLGTSQRSYLLQGAMVITRQPALDDHQHPEPVFLFVPGNAGGLQAFTSVAQLKTQLARSVRADPDGFWLGHVSLKNRAAARAAIMLEGTESPVILRVLDGHAFSLGVEDQIAGYKEIASLIARGQLLYSESTVAQSLERLRLETAQNLLAPGNEAREQGIDLVAEQLRTAQATQDLPDWLLRASVEERAEYAKGLVVYARNALWLEDDLNRHLPSFEVFTRDKLAERLKADLKRDIDPDAVRVDMPDRVIVEVLQTSERAERPHLAGDTSESIAITGFSTWDDVSLARHTFSLSELARKNIDVNDEQQMLRLKHSYFTLDGVDTKALGIDLKYLLKTIPDLDVAMLYSMRITRAFLGRTVGVSQPGAPDIARRLGVFRQAINLEAWVARQRSHLSERGYRLAQAATAPGNGNHKPDAEFDIEYRYTWLRSPDRGDSSYTEQALIGVSVVHDKTSGLALMYLAGAPGNQKFFEGSGFQHLIERLSNHVLLNRELLTYFANSTETGSSVARNIQNINAILRVGTYGFLVIDPVKASHVSLTDMQYLARMGRLKEQVYGSSRSALDIERRQMERIAQRDLSYIKIGLSVIPGIGTTIGVYDGWNDASAAISAFARGDYKAGAWLAFSAALNLGEAVLTLAPLVARPRAVSAVLGSLDETVTKAVATLYDAGWRASKSLQKKRLKDLLPSVTSRKPWRTKAFEGYEVKVPLYDAVRLRGKNENVYLLNNKMYIQIDEKVYEVYRRSGEKTLRLKARPPKNYEPPIRMDARGRWEYHADVGGKGGAPFPELEELIVDSTPVTSTRKVPDGYAVTAAVTPAPIPAVHPQGVESMDRVVIGHRDLFVSSELDSAGNFGIYRIDPADPTRLQAQGVLTPEGVYRLTDQPLVSGSDLFEEVAEDFVFMDNKFYRVQLDTEQFSWKVVRTGDEGSSTLFIESDGVFDPVTQRLVISNWHLMPRLGEHPSLEALVRQALDLPATGFDHEVYAFLRNYTRQIIQSVDTQVIRAPDVLELERLCEQSLRRKQFPVGRLDEALTAMANKQPLPIWAPVYDELQGMRSVFPTTSGRYYNIDAVRQLRSHMSIRDLDVEVAALIDNYAAMRAGLISTFNMRNTLAKSVMQLVLKKRGYTLLDGGRYKVGAAGFGMVLRGPNGDLYLMEVRHIRATGNTWGHVFFDRGSASKLVMMSDEWVDIVVRKSLEEVPFNPAAVAVQQARADGRLFKLVGTITPDKEVMVFKVATPGPGL